MIIKEKIILKNNEKYTVIKAILRRWYETFDNDNGGKYTTVALETEKPMNLYFITATLVSLQKNSKKG